MKIIGSLLFAFSLLLCGCGDDTPTGTEDENFRVTVRVSDPDGAPQAGVSINASNALDGVATPDKARLKIPFTLAESSVVRLRVLDIAGQEVRFLVNEILEAGPHEVSWDGRDTAGTEMPAGVYTVNMVAYEVGGSTPSVSGSTQVFLMRLERSHVLGVTDDAGELVLTDPGLFPGLLFQGNLDAVDETGLPTGDFSLLRGARFWAWQDAEGPLATVEAALTDGANTVELTLDPDAKTADVPPCGQADPTGTTALADGTFPWSFGPPYPNPFN